MTKPNRLAQILEDLLSLAMQHGRSHKQLRNGLHIKIETNTDGNTLTLARQNVRPSMDEWDTVTKNFPYIVPRIVPTPGQTKGYLTISAKLPLRQAEQLKFG